MSHDGFKCSECGQSLSTKQSLTQHLQSKHNIGNQPLLKCRFADEGCTYANFRRSKVTEHEKTHSDERPYPCTFEGCGSVFRRKDHLDAHVNGVHTREVVHQCDKCEYNTPWKPDMIKHMRDNHDPVTGEYVRTGMENRITHALQQALGAGIPVETHVRIALTNPVSYLWVDMVVQMHYATVIVEIDEGQHKDPTKYSLRGEVSRMQIVSQVFLQRADVNNVVWIRFNPDGYTVNGKTAKTTFESRIQQVVSFIQHHQPQQELEVMYMFYDEVEGRPAILYNADFDEDLKASVINHRVLQTGGGASALDVDPDNADDVEGGASVLVKRAAPVSDDANSRTCPICSKVFKTRENLGRHLRQVHGNQKRARVGPFPCSYEGCEAEFASKQLVKAHEQHVHEGISWTCDICDAISTSPANLATHKKMMHSDDVKMRQCPHCSFQTKWSQSLAKHILRNHPDK